jgi:repressor LexA
MALTKRQKQILDYVESFLEGYGYSPSFEEIASHFGYNSLATVHEHLSNLERKGYLRKNYNKSRSLELVQAEGALAVELPLLGSVAAGLPIEAIEEQETLAVPHDMLRGGNNYVLRVRGDSMVEEQIRDGDYIVVNSRQTALDGGDGRRPRGRRFRDGQEDLSRERRSGAAPAGQRRDAADVLPGGRGPDPGDRHRGDPEVLIIHLTPGFHDGH